jgi:NADH:ubiquinone reductase (H+-translocating)
LSCVSEDGATCDDGTFIPSATVLSTLGQARSRLAGTEDFERTADGRILADPELRVQQQPNVWIAGDIAHVSHPREGGACPPNALWAIKGGEHVGANIARTLLGKPIKAFTFPGLGQAASLGVGQGITELYGMQFTGWFAWTLRLLLFHHFMPSKKKALKVMLDFITLPLLGRGTEALEPAEVVEEHNPRTLKSSSRKPWDVERGSVGQASNKALD